MQRQSRLAFALIGLALAACGSSHPSPYDAGIRPSACAIANGGCDPNAVCLDTPSGPNCICGEGYAGDGMVCTPSNDPCTVNNGGCDPNATCSFDMATGLPVCTCTDGYMGDGMTCTSIDFCGQSPGPCDPNAMCADTPGSYTCTCNSGFSANGTTCVAEGGPCATSNGGCDPNARCNYDSSANKVTCTCHSGYTGDGMTCTMAPDPCATGNGGCDSNATCTNNGGVPACKCNAGYTGNGTTCTATTSGPCATNNGGCDPNAACSAETDGGISCTCNVGYAGNGMTCTPAAPGGLGAPCSTASNCKQGEECLAIGMCTMTCTSDADCGVNGTLQNVCFMQNGQSACLLACDPNMADPCGRPDYVCSQTTSSTGANVDVCVPNCTQQNICGYPTQCNADTGQCGVAACTSTDSCPSGQVCYTPPTGGNACVPDCRVAGNSCPMGFTCNSGGACDAAQPMLPTVGTNQACGPTIATCEPGNDCLSANRQMGACMKQCNTPADCPPDLEGNQDCGLTVGAQNYCVWDCNYSISECPSAEQCNLIPDNNGQFGCSP